MMQPNSYRFRLRALISSVVRTFHPPYNIPSLRSHTLNFNIGQLCHGQISEVLYHVDLTMRYVNRFIKMESEKADVLKYHLDTSPLLAACDFSPYHYRVHTENMCANALEGFLYTKAQALIKAVGGSDDELARDLFLQLRALLLAALYHDAGHSYGLLTDRRNVAIAASIYWVESASADCHGYKDYYFIPALIESTEFPHDNDFARLKAYQDDDKYESAKELVLILRDADMMGSYIQDEEKLAELFVGLFLESKLKHPDLTIEQFHENQKTFQNTMVKWNTDWAKEKAQVMGWDTRHLAVAKVVMPDNPVIKSLVDCGAITNIN